MASMAFWGVQSCSRDLVELLDVREEEVAGRVRLGALAAQDHFLTPGAAPLWRDQRQFVEDAVAGEVLLQPLVDNDVGRNDQEVGREIRTRHSLLVEV